MNGRTPALILALTLAAAVPVQEDPPRRSLEPPVLLPDGTEFRTWEPAALSFDRTCVVDGAHPEASDDGPGTEARPFRTIHRAAQVLQPGERVVVRAGTYRERVLPARGGTGPGRMISYEAAPGAEVILKGSIPFAGPWTPSEGTPRTWSAPLDPKTFGEKSPFLLDNVLPEDFERMTWAHPLRGKVPFTLPRGLVFQEGRILAQVAEKARLAERDGAYWVDRAARVLHVRPAGDADPAKASFEVTVHGTVFGPAGIGLGYIRIKGFRVEHAGNAFPMPQQGAISTNRGHHWIIEGNRVAWSNGAGIDVGTQAWWWPQPETVGFHVVRGNVVTDSGVCGIAGLGPGRREFGLLIEDNVIRRSAWHDVERLYETAGIKTHNNVGCLVRRNRVEDVAHGPGIWLDWDNRNTRCSGNVVIGSASLHGGIFVEASQVPNLVDQNVVLGCRGHGLFEHDSFGQTYAHNLVAGCTGSPVYVRGKCTDRKIAGKVPRYGGARILNNVFSGNGRPVVTKGEPSESAGNVEAGITVAWDAEKLTATLAAEAPPAPVRGPGVILADFLGRRRDPAGSAPGPFATFPEGPVPLR